VLRDARIRGKFIAYYRVSTDKQGKFGPRPRRPAPVDHLNGGKWQLLDELVEVESGKRNDRSELLRALAAYKKHQAKLVIAKLDRLSRNLAFPC
jgi:DNA invertase Pin-like site-specific DNA recombinase